MNSNIDRRRRALLKAGTATALLPYLPGVHAQASFPSGPIKLLVGASAGGTMDLSARLMGQAMSEILGQPVIVENKTGAAGVLSMQQLVRSKPDGLTLAWVGNGVASISPYLYKSPGYDVKNLAIVSQAASTAFALYAAANAPFSDLKGLVAYAKTNPKKTFFGSSGTYSSLHLLAEMLNVEAGIEAVHVPFRGAADATAALLGGQVHYLFDGLSANLPLVAAGKVKCLAVTTTARQAALPDVPTIAEAGFPTLTSQLFYGMVSPPGTAPDVVAKLAGAMKEAAESPQLRQSYGKAGLEPRASGAQEFRELIEREGSRVKALMKSRNFTPQE
ncbi:MAG: tripartite tricarboxylate transporter substrate binding protein [Variovorax sp.]